VPTAPAHRPMRACGASYLGFVQWASASASDRLKAIAPAVTTTDYYTTPWYSEGGALSLQRSSRGPR
jgi:predicted acyl esterase